MEDNEENSVPFTFRLTPSLDDLLELEVKRRGATKSGIIRLALEKELGLYEEVNSNATQ